jgi:hypothetical protein
MELQLVIPFNFAEQESDIVNTLRMICRSLTRVSTVFVLSVLLSCPLRGFASEMNSCVGALSEKTDPSLEAKLGPLMDDLVLLMNTSVWSESEFQRVVSSNLLAQKTQELQAQLGPQMAKRVLHELQIRTGQRSVIQAADDAIEVDIDLSQVRMRPEPVVPPPAKQAFSIQRATVMSVRAAALGLFLVGLYSLTVEHQGLASNNSLRLSSHPSARPFSLQEKVDAKAKETFKTWEEMDRSRLHQKYDPYKAYLPSEVVDWFVERLAWDAE